jgi:short subunit dehydrogenase
MESSRQEPISSIFFCEIGTFGGGLMNRALRNELLTILGVGALGALLLRKPRLLTGFGVAAATVALAADPPFEFRGTSVVIIDGAHGLGLALAQELAREGAFVTLLGQDVKELDRARGMLVAELPGAQIHTVVCDVQRAEQVHSAFDEVLKNFGAIDVLINNADVITAIDVVLPQFLLHRKARVINIGTGEITTVLPAATATKSVQKIIKACREGRHELSMAPLSKARKGFAVLFPELSMAAASLLNRWTSKVRAPSYQLKSEENFPQLPEESEKVRADLLH